jgi:hypothetical protein
LRGNLETAKIIRRSDDLDTTSSNLGLGSHSESYIKSERLMQNQPNYIRKLYREILDANPANALIIYDYIIAEETETNTQKATK